MAGPLDGLWIVKEAGEIQPKLFTELRNLDFRPTPPADVCYLTLSEETLGLVVNTQSWNLGFPPLRKTR